MPGPLSWAIAVLFDSLILGALKKSHDCAGTYGVSSSVSKTISDQPTLDWGGEKKSRGWFLRVIIFIPEQLEDTSLNVLPKSQPSEIRAGGGAGVFTMLHGSKPHTHTHTRHSVSLKIHGLPGTLRALSVRSQSEELLLRKVSVNVHVGLVDVADYGTGGGPVGAEQEGDSLFPVGKTNTGALWEERKGLVSMGRPHRRAVRWHSAGGAGNCFTCHRPCSARPSWGREQKVLNHLHLLPAPQQPAAGRDSQQL